ncbi:MAG TPA: hypothetical protein ENG83_16075 [Nitrospirae bacterium]|nr:hypothetical protein BMS3Abin06_00479 [bacterium BMS3Abin06]HDH13688.1 hypothetical protein [Nitrospirota bacterium]HDZ02725.1 hypothetical protein [Nitrospirota bacterium]
MPYKIEFLPDAAKDFDSLDKSVRKEATKKIDTLSKNPFIGKPLGKKPGIKLTGFYKLYFAKKKRKQWGQVLLLENYKKQDLIII